LGSGQEFEEDCWTETRAAVAGGVTSLFSYLKVEGSYFNVIAKYKRAIEENSLIDIGLHGIVLDPVHLQEIGRYTNELGIRSFKFFMAYKGEDALGILKGIDDGFLYEGLQAIRDAGGLAIVHAENGEIIRLMRERLKGSPRSDLSLWSESRPNLCEEEATRRAIFLATKVGCRLCIAHMSIQEGVPLLTEQKFHKNPVFCETCTHYLILTKDISLPNASWGKVNPPLRDEKDVQALWSGLKEGAIDMIGSDHWSATREKKEGDIWTAHPGLTGIGLTLPVLLSEGVNQGRLTLQEITRISSLNPSKILGVFPQKGLIEIGFDADLVLVNLDKEVTVTTDILHSHSDFTPYEGLKLKGWPEVTIVDGKIIYQDGDIMQTSNKGKYLRR
jgi:dihydroorotase-like cyclic amidohydrolase